MTEAISKLTTGQHLAVVSSDPHSSVQTRERWNMRYRVTMTIDIEEVHENPSAKKSIATPTPEPATPIIQPAPSKLLYNIIDTARVLGIGRSSVYHLLKNGQLPFVKLGRRTLIPVQTLQTLVNSSKLFESTIHTPLVK